MYFRKLLYVHSVFRTEKNHVKFSPGNQQPCWKSNPVSLSHRSRTVRMWWLRI